MMNSVHNLSTNLLMDFTDGIYSLGISVCIYRFSSSGPTNLEHGWTARLGLVG